MIKIRLTNEELEEILNFCSEKIKKKIEYAIKVSERKNKNRKTKTFINKQTQYLS